MGEGSIFAVSDIHLGSRRKNQYSNPEKLGSFINWLIRLREGEKVKIKLGHWGKERKEKVLKPSEKLIMLGDVMELWDSTDRGVELCSRPIFNILEKLNCEKIYILGNHDYDLKPYIGTYPSGKTKLRIVEELYPTQDQDYPLTGEKRKVSTLKIGDKDYLFIHGYQFDRIFTYQPWKLFPNIRNGALAFGSYGNLFVGLLVISSVITVINFLLIHYFTGIPSFLNFKFPFLQYLPGFLGLNQDDWDYWIANFSLLGNVSLVIIWLVLSFPRIFYLYARDIWNKFAGTRYNHRASVKGVLNWWDRFSKNKVVKSKDLRIVYGHTHLIDVIDQDELSKAKGQGKKVNITAVNIPAWVKDYTKMGWGLLTDVSLYIDGDDELFIGWDEQLERPFYVPIEVVDEKAKNGVISKDTAKKLEKIDWPQTIVDEWKGERKFHEVRAKDLE
ncbi:MAG: hypothetical protein WED07_00100 [Candidatus Freyarchaeum deiterrae]